MTVSSVSSQSNRTRNEKLLTSQLTLSEQRWLKIRSHFQEHRYRLAVYAARHYSQLVKVDSTPLLSTPHWLPDHPIPLDQIELQYTPDAAFTGVTGTEPAAQQLLPVRADGSRYRTYSEAVAALAAPGLFENRSTYRLLRAELHTAPRMVFGRGSYFDGIDVGDAAAHEFTAVTLGEMTAPDFRATIADPCDVTRRPVNVALSTLTLRHNATIGTAVFPLHRRDGTAVGHAAGMYQVLPVGIFQPVGEQPWNIQNDFSLWRCIIRELAEELRGETENYGTDRGPIDYDSWVFSAQLNQAIETGQVRVFCVGIGVDPLTFATDILTVVTVDAPLYDELFAHIADTNPEGSIVPAVPFTAENVKRYASHEPTQAAGAALLRLAWRHRSVLQH